MDEDAKRNTDKKYGVSATIIGSPRHALYARINFDTLRTETLEQLALNEESVVHGIFCQPLPQAGYLETIEAWAETVKETNHDKIIYRPHPSTSKSLALNIEKILEQRGLDYIILDKANIEQVIVVCTTISSVLSNSNLDVAYVNYFSS